MTASSSSSSNSDAKGNTAPATECPVDHTTMKKAPAEEPLVCPVDHSGSAKAFSSAHPAIDPYNQMPAEPEQARAHGQKETLSTERMRSSIPRAERYESAGPSECPALHDAEPAADAAKEKKDDMWDLPRKNWDPTEHDMKSVVPIHNAVNEMCWHHILQWEKMHQTQCGSPRLLAELTPRARFYSLLGYTKPFDRHDWTVDRCGKSVRKDPKNPHAPSFYLDVRPALTLEGAWDRTRKYFGF
ncbi:cytochrome c and c1 heme-lyase [Linderina pennispora]|uniref:Holocytochrome c-type synthase n=1 Tax=Linderina pennispora TaxID=61395 RepID=A0A1Y1WDG6_9FUNG|nr:cytochrome c and c1 heme-lyase [Linderina pennispora]ORX71276.1 cytochrome c and c1 heme-lyase [Linderina pennispora]